MRDITLHHDGHALNNSIKLTADSPGPGGASHRYTATIDGQMVAYVQFQTGPRNEPGSVPGVTQGVLLAVVEDTIASFQAGPFACPENDELLEAVRKAMSATKRRANERAARGVLGTSKV